MGETGNDFSTILQLRLSTTHPLILSDLGMDSAAFMAFCQENPEIRIERNTSGQIIAMPPTSSETGRINASITIELGIWNRVHRPGVVFDSSTGFHLSNGADRSPDTSWIKKERWEALTTAQKTKFAPIAPDFVVELRSADQSIHDLRSKMEEYISCGVRLGWLVDPTNKCTYVYTENGFIQTFPFETQLTGEDVLPGFSLRMIDLF